MSATEQSAVEKRKQRTITLTNRAPVKIYEDEWPAEAEGLHHDHDGQVPAQANRETTARIVVRRHADGRALVYGVYDYDTRFQNEKCYVYREGVLLATADAGEGSIVRHIRDTERRLVARGADDETMRQVAAECIADLPAETL